ncbi:MAG: hypothetical protein WBZ00_00790, partial [Solirubrobacterales bacterium]
ARLYRAASPPSVEAADTEGREVPGIRAGTRTFTRTPSPSRITASPRKDAGSARRAADSASEPTFSARAPARAAFPADHRTQPATTVWAAIIRQTARAGSTATNSTEAWALPNAESNRRLSHMCRR